MDPPQLSLRGATIPNILVGSLGYLTCVRHISSLHQDTRPRKTLGYATPADRLAAAVASTRLNPLPVSETVEFPG